MEDFLEDRQVQLEIEARDKAAHDYLAKVEFLSREGNPGHLASRRAMTSSSIAPLTKAIDRWKQEWENTSRPGRRLGAYTLVKDCPSDRLAFLTLRTFLTKATAKGAPPATATATSLGGTVEREMCFEKLRVVKPGVWKWLKNNGRLDGSSFRWRGRILKKAAQWGNLDWMPWTAKQKLMVGLHLMNLLEQSLGICELTTEAGKAHPYAPFRKRNVYQLTPKAIKWLEQQDFHDAWAHRVLFPMVEEPVPWTEPDDGGYVLYREPFCKTRNVDWLVDQTGRDLSVVYSAMNAVQKTPFAIVEDVLITAEHAWTADWRVKGTAELDEVDLPAAPEGAEKDSDEWKMWKVMLAKTHAQNRRQRSRRFSLLATLKQAKRHRDDLVYFPTQVDTRGRLYTMPTDLTPQGPDIHRGLLTFGEHKRLTEPEQWAWLKRHGANCAGHDKLSFEERERWVDDNVDLIEAIAKDPFSQREWTEFDKPFAFLSFALDYVHALETERSALPVAMDGTCSGLQHYSAMLRDPQGAAAVNLVPGSRPNDIYGTVAARLEATLQEQAGEDSTEGSLARQWLASGLVNRTLCKRPTMTTPYGVTAHGVLAQTTDLIRGVQLELGRLPFEDDTGWTAVRHISPLILQAIHGAVPKALEAMHTIRAAAGAIAGAGMQAGWVIPSTGFHVQQSYVRSEQQRVRTHLNGEIRSFKLRIDKEDRKVARGKAVAASAPNLVHSLDAAHLMMTVNAMEAQAPTPVSYAMVHDSFACHAADAPLMAQILREEFVRLYEGDHLLANLLEQMREGLEDKHLENYPEAPAQGDFDLELVKQSPYFFA